jgi:hypothetical protein
VRRIRADTKKTLSNPTSAGCRAVYSTKRSTKVLGHTLCQLALIAYRQCAFEISPPRGEGPKKPGPRNHWIATSIASGNHRRAAHPSLLFAKVNQRAEVNKPSRSVISSKRLGRLVQQPEAIFLPIPLRSPPHLPELAAPTPLGGLADDFTSGQRMRLTERQEL